MITFLSSRSPRVQKVVKAHPTLLLYQGRPLDETLRRERVSREEVYAAVRSNGEATIEAVAAVVLETDGSFSVLTSIDGPTSALEGVEGYAEARRAADGGDAASSPAR